MDVAVSVLSHFCILIKDEWNLDEKSFGAFCNTETVLGNIKSESKIKVYPNSGSDYIVFKTGEVNYKNVYLNIYNSSGILVKKIPVLSRETVLKSENLASGMYYYKIEESEIFSTAGKFVISR